MLYRDHFFMILEFLKNVISWPLFYILVLKKIAKKGGVKQKFM